jgi:serine/threonine-protein kinase SRPK3
MDTISSLDDQPLGPEVPPYTVEPAYFQNPGYETLEKQIKIIEFGEASFSNEERKTLHMPMPLRAPDSFFNERIGLPADIWALVCTIFDIFGERSLFDTFMPDRDSVLLEMVSTLGLLPNRWWVKWEIRSRYFSSGGAPNTNIMPNYAE